MLVSFSRSFVQIERPGDAAYQTLRDVKKYYPLHMPWPLANKPPLHVRLAARIESVPQRVRTVARIGGDVQVTCHTYA